MSRMGRNAAPERDRRRAERMELQQRQREAEMLRYQQFAAHQRAVYQESHRQWADRQAQPGTTLLCPNCGGASMVLLQRRTDLTALQILIYCLAFLVVLPVLGLVLIVGIFLWPVLFIAPALGASLGHLLGMAPFLNARYTVVHCSACGYEHRL